MQTKLITCNICLKRNNYYGFILKKGFIYGDMSGIHYATTGTIKNEKMYIFFCENDQWNKKLLNATETLPTYITAKYGDEIKRRNQEYKTFDANQLKCKDDIITQAEIEDLTNNIYYEYIIVEHKINEDTENNIIWQERPIAEAILISIGRKQTRISVNGVDYRIICHKDTDKIAPYKPIYLTEKQAIWVFRFLNNTKCFKDNHETRAIYAFVKSKKTNRFVEISGVIYCDTCGKFFISEASVSSFEKAFGELLLNKLPCALTHNMRDDNYSGSSELYLNGYRARDKDTTSIRRKILCHLIDKGVMTKGAIIRDLSDDIYRFDGHYNFVKAVAKWEDDLLFVQQYNSESNIGVYGELKYKYGI